MTATLATGTRVTISGIGTTSPFEVLNGRTGTIVPAPAGRRAPLITVHLDYPVSADEVALMFGTDGTLDDVTGEDVTGHRVDMLARHLTPEATPLDPSGFRFRALAANVLREIYRMRRHVRREGGSEIWAVLSDAYDIDRVVAEMPHTITTGEDARAWVHHRVAQDAFGF